MKSADNIEEICNKNVIEILKIIRAKLSYQWYVYGRTDAQK